MGLTLKLTQISKEYNGNPVLRECSYTFAAGGFYLLRGPNGSGKSTLFRIAALLERPDDGTVRYLGSTGILAPDIHLRRRLTMVFPRVGVFNNTVFENVAYGLKMRGLEKSLIRERVPAILEKVGLAHKMKQQAVTLSSGETMRLGLARALIIDPEVLFLDEPTTHLDPVNSQVIEDCIVRIREERPLTLIMITHDQSQADRLGGQKLFLHEGRIDEG